MAEIQGHNQSEPPVSNDIQALPKHGDEEPDRLNGTSSSSHLLAGEPTTNSDFLHQTSGEAIAGVISVRETAKLSFHFSLLWVVAFFIVSLDKS